MKFKILKILFISGLNCLYAQQFGPDIIIDSTYYTNLEYRVSAALSLDNENNLGITWTDIFYNNDIINYISSTNGGVSFNEKVIVEDDSMDPGGEFRRTSSVFFDSNNNPLILYYHASFPYYYVHLIKKSFDQGQTFSNNWSLFFLSNRPQAGHLWESDSINYLCFQDFYSNNIFLIKTLDEGLTFSDSISIPLDSNALVSSTVSIIRATDNDMLCFWTGQNYNTHKNSVYYNRSTDGGNSFCNKIEIDSISSSVTQVYAISYNDYVFIIYQRKVDNNYQLLFRKSTDGGYKFSDPMIIYESINPALIPFLQYKTNYGLCIIWNNGDFNSPITYFMHSKDLGSSFDSTVIINTNSRLWYNSVAISDSGDVYIVSVKDSNNYLILNKAKLDPVTSVDEDFDIINSYQLYQNYPNPFNPIATIKYQIPQDGLVTLKVYDILGKEIKTLVNEHNPTGRYEINFDASNLASGVYIYRIQVNPSTSSGQVFVSTKKMMLVK